MWYGAAYYPEHWPQERWRDDARLMKEAGFNVARLGEFAWCRMEPKPDEFSFAWLDEAIEALAEQGLAVLLGTPTAGPPVWLVNAASADQDCRMLYEDGTRWEAGGRSLCCVNHPRFVERSRRIVEAMSRRYVENPAVMGWQLDNEIGMYGVRCYCPHCVAGFRQWLEEKYGDIDTLNNRLGMVFGSNEFGSFGEVPIPRLRQDLHNPGLLLDSHRFFADSNAAYLVMQAETLRACGVRRPITHNVCHMMSGWTGIDGEALFRHLDVAGWDSYPQQFATDPRPATMGLLHAIARGYKNQRYWMLEQQSGAPFGMAAVDPERIRLWAWQSVAHGADMILYFRWRTCRFGGEQYWQGILDHVGSENARYDLIRRMGAELARLSDRLTGLRPAAKAAILLDFDNCMSITHGTNAGGPKLAYRQHAESWYEALRRRGWGVDVVYEPPAPGEYEIVIAPALRLMSAKWAERLRTFVERGGTLVATVTTATLHRDHVAPAEPVPWKLTQVFGVERVGWSALARLSVPPKELAGADGAAWERLGSVDSIPVIGEVESLGTTYRATTWCDHLSVMTARTLARFAEGSPPGPTAAITENRFGQGCAVYVASVVEQACADQLIEMLLAAPPDAPASGDDKVEIVPCNTDGGPLCFVLNHGATPAQVTLPAAMRELISDRVVGPVMTVEPYNVAVLADIPR